MKDENKKTYLLAGPVYFDNQLIWRVTFDLVHINQGWDEIKYDYAYKNRSSYTPDDILEIFEQFRFFQIAWVLGVNKFKEVIKGVKFYRYHWHTTDEAGKIVRVYCDLPVNYNGEGIIVTVFSPRS